MSEHAINSPQQPTVSEADTDFYPDPTTRFPGSGDFHNPLQPMERAYSLTQLLWHDSRKGELHVYVALVGRSSPFLLARLPIAWLERSALSTSAPSAWSFVQELVQFCVDQPGFLVRSDDEHGQRVDTSIAPRAGNYTFVTENGQPATLSVGPIGKKKGVIPSNWPPS
ncbi:BZ3500_MvSof-1268-A1-R1_Chr3-3g06383 [Microbotryum saponariae]|uniref:BZ3500_MvSof-1268-A1-R1_Chr3-3g06383 protein n=1 Tax=Microbotryum saponariae TaxID=289078 RepID=A0A2X0KXA5_9BASI|nr:BZ3500_MvSof-1268-A1-R1_Chr3-3g06383 [Microbotryum saponariae]SDA04350.1 BZ3501_MvSof-1269-A2-R1_Chr3-2g06070 [Microbotryum saponariae]